MRTLKAYPKIPWGSSREAQRSQTAISAKTRRTAGLLALACLNSTAKARCGDTRVSPPWPEPKPLTAGPHAIFRQALSPVSIIIPTLNEELAIGRALETAKQIPGVREIIVVDGGSSDATRDIVRDHHVNWITASRGRGPQLHAGACAASGDVIWFLHADTHPPEDGVEQILSALRVTNAVGGSFDVVFDNTSMAARFLTRFYRCWRRLGICYGDSAIFVRAQTYREVGGFKPFPLFEDLDLVRRLKRHGHFIQLKTQVSASCRRFERRSFALTFTRWSMLQLLYWCGVHPEHLNRMYAPIRAPRSPAVSARPERKTGNPPGRIP